MNLNFKKALIDLQKEYRTQAPYMEKDNGLTIDENDFNSLSAFEKRTIETVAKMYRLINSNDKNIDYNLLVQSIEELAQSRSDSEKQYLISLFFPERVKHMNVLYPFPVPTYPFIQKISGRISPNSSGNFVMQAVCPLLVDTSSTASTVYINTNDALDGLNRDNNTAHYVPLTTTRCLPNAFNAYVLQCFKISVQYIGRSDIQSGIFGGAYFVSTANSLSPDVNASLFDYIDDSINAVKVDSTDGLNVIYYPLDLSYTHFMTINTDNVATHAMNTSLRLCIYGSALPNGSVDAANGSPNCIAFQVYAIYNIIPSQSFNELLPVDFTIQPNDKFDMIKTAQLINSSKLSAYPSSKIGEIERFIELPSNIKNDAINTFNYNLKQNGKSSKYHNILDVVHKYVSDDLPSRINLDKKLITNIKALPEAVKEINKTNKFDAIKPADKDDDKDKMKVDDEINNVE